MTRDDQSNALIARAPGQTADRDISWLDRSILPNVSADGQWVAFTDASQTGGANYSAMLRKTDGSPAVRVGEGSAAAISRDARWIVVHVSTPTQFWLYPAGAGDPRKLNWPALKTVNTVDFFPDSKSLFVCGSPDDKSARCYRSPLDASALEPVTPDSIGSGIVRPDGKMVFVKRGADYWTYPIGGGSLSRVSGIGADSVIRWSPDGTALWVETATSAGPRMMRVEVPSGRRSPLPSINAPLSIFRFIRLSLADDPRAFVYETRTWSSLLFTVSGMR